MGIANINKTKIIGIGLVVTFFNVLLIDKSYSYFITELRFYIYLPLYYQRVPRKERQAKAMSYLERVGLKEWSHHLPSELSGGQKQRVAIARAMVAEPKVLLADELTGALDSTTSYEVMDLIQKINDQGNTILVVTHEDDIAHMCKRIVYLKDGVIIKDEKVKQVRASAYV